MFIGFHLLLSGNQACVIRDFIKGEPGTQTRLKQTPPTDIAVSVITVMELRYGLLINPQRAQKVEPTISSSLASVTVLPFGNAEAEQAAPRPKKLHNYHANQNSRCRIS